jgi:hypothetical protein
MLTLELRDLAPLILPTYPCTDPSLRIELAIELDLDGRSIDYNLFSQMPIIHITDIS